MRQPPAPRLITLSACIIPVTRIGSLTRARISWAMKSHKREACSSPTAQPWQIAPPSEITGKCGKRKIELFGNANLPGF